jgi:hypothetical protein
MMQVTLRFAREWLRPSWACQPLRLAAYGEDAVGGFLASLV